MTGGESFWIASTPGSGYPPLAGELGVDVAVAGGGVAGLTTALLLKEAGLSVAVLEAARVGTGVTGHTTGKVTAGHGLLYSRLERRHGGEAARRYAASQRAGVELVFSLAERLGIECDLERADNWVYAVSDDEVEALERERDAQRRAGLAAELRLGLELPFPARAGLRLAEQGQFHARKYLLGLARAVHGDGSTVCERTRVETFEEGGELRIRTPAGLVRARHLVLATNAAITAKGHLYARAHPYRSYVLAAEVAEDELAGMWINAGSPTRSLRTTPLGDGRRLLLLVGEGHRVGQADDERSRYDALHASLAEWFPAARLRHRWSTQDQYSVDSLPFVGRVGGIGSRVYVATGFGGWGLSNGTLAGLLLRDLIAGRPSAWTALYDPGRRSLVRSPATFLLENANVALRAVQGRLGGHGMSLDDVRPGEGRVLELGGEKVAASRDERGELRLLSALCPHMGCVVAWNRAERSWDCPCHGSRFAADGRVLEGPATKPLAAVEERRTAGAR